MVRRVHFRVIVTLAALSCILLSLDASAQGQNYIVSFQRGTPTASRADAVQRAGAAVRVNYTIVDAVAISAPNPNVLRVLGQNPLVQSIVPDRIMTAVQSEQAQAKGKPAGGGTTSEVTPAGVQRVGVPTPGSDGNGVGVAVIDTGIDLLNSDLSVSSNKFDATGGTCQDDNGHGTHVSGIVAALSNGLGVVGVAPKAKLYCVKVLDASGSGSDSQVLNGLDWVLANHSTMNPPIGVVNMSLGRPGTLDDNPAMRGAVKQLHLEGVVIVVAAGNDSNLEVKQQVPATYPEVLAVASTTALKGTNRCRNYSGEIAADTASYFTSDGKFDPTSKIGVTISAPGEDEEDINSGCFISSVGILSTRLGGGTTRMSGTSMASPHVAGVVARLLQSGMAGVENIRGYIRTSAADKRGSAPYASPTLGYSFDGEWEGIAHLP